MEPFQFATGWGMVHEAGRCGGKACCLHNPSHHHMVSWPIDLWPDATTVRLCHHGVAHPDPDSLAYYLTWEEARGYNVQNYNRASHQCDGCCVPPTAEQILEVLREIEKGTE